MKSAGDHRDSPGSILQLRAMTNEEVAYHASRGKMRCEPLDKPREAATIRYVPPIPPQDAFTPPSTSDPPNPPCPPTKPRPLLSKVKTPSTMGPPAPLFSELTDVFPPALGHSYNQTAKLKSREEHIRETWVKAMEARIVRENLSKCQKVEGVNHYEKCKDLAERYTDMLRESKVCVTLFSSVLTHNFNVFGFTRIYADDFGL